MKVIFSFFLSILLFIINLNAQLYVAPDGLDTNDGKIDSPFASIIKAITFLNPGDTIYVRGGIYNFTATISISSAISGTDSSRYHLFAYKNEKPLLDFSGMSSGPKGISLKAHYWHIKGLAVKGAGDNGMNIDGGSNNIIEACSFFENRDTGLQLGNGASNNRIINCDSYYNADPPDYGDADGFAPKLTVGDGNYFYGCRSWGNCDDGWDGYMRGATDVTTTLENCWTWGNGYLKDGTDPGSQANGNGFKMGGGDNSNADLLMHHFILINCFAFDNKNKGFDQNNNVGSMTLYNCTGYNNGAANYRIQRELNSGQSLIVKNSLSFQGEVQLGSFAIEENNSWHTPFDVTEEDFKSLDKSSAYSIRKPDSSLPAIDFMNLVEGSDMIDGGVDLGFPFKGNAPDLGAFESDLASNVQEYISVSSVHKLYQNYPNPFNPSTIIKYQIAKPEHIQIKIYDILGNLIATLVNELKSPGIYESHFEPKNIASGIYYYRLIAGEFSETKRLVLIR